MVAFQIILCILAADLITGLVHWAEDTYGLPSWLLIGESVIRPNILHHSDPTHFTMSSVLYRNYQVMMLAAWAVLIAYCLGVLTWQVALVASLASIGNEVHAWAHKRPRWTAIRLLQDMKLVISPEQHAKHHRKPYDCCFCTLTNWLNPVLDALQFWRGLEIGLAMVGIKSQRMSAARGGY